MGAGRGKAELRQRASSVSLLALDVETFPADALPPDLAGTPAVKPGSK